MVDMNGIYALVAFVFGWLIAQLWKLIQGALSGRQKGVKRDLKDWVGYFTRSGGMPSGHSACMVATSVYLGCVFGWDSGVFALAVASTAIVLYDATHVRYAVGLQGEALNKILRKNGEKPLPLTEGHTVSQVVVGCILGVAVGILTYFWFGK